MLLVLYHFHWGVIYDLESITSSVLVNMLVLLPLLSTPKIDFLGVSGEMVFFRGFRDSVVFIFLIVLHNLMNVPVLIRCVIFEVTFGTDVSRLATAVADDITFDFLYKHFPGGGVFCSGRLRSRFRFCCSYCFMSIFFHSRHLLLPRWSLDIDHFPKKNGTAIYF